MGIDLDTFFITAPFRTDALKADLVELRDDLYAMRDEHSALAAELSRIEGIFNKLEEKTTFVQDEILKMSALFVPPEPTGEEKAFDVLKRYVYDPLEYGQLGVGVIGGAVWLAGLSGPGVMKALSKIPRLGRAARVGKSARWMKIAKVGKAGVVLALAIFAVELGIKMSNATKINAHMRKERGTLEKQVADGEEAIDELRAAIAEGQATIDSLLADGGFADVDAYVKGMNAAIADIGRQKANLRAARRMLIDGMPQHLIGRYVPGLTAEAMSSLAARVAAEAALVSGASTAEAAAAAGISPAQVAALSVVIEARGILLQGDGVGAAVAATELPTTIVVAEAEVQGEDLRALWSEIDGEGADDTLSDKLVVPAAAVARLRAELAVKRAVATGTAPGAITGHDAATVAGWADEVEAGRGEVALLADDAKDRRLEMAADLRLPLAALA